MRRVGRGHSLYFLFCIALSVTAINTVGPLPLTTGHLVMATGLPKNTRMSDHLSYLPLSLEEWFAVLRTICSLQYVSYALGSFEQRFKKLCT